MRRLLGITLTIAALGGPVLAQPAPGKTGDKGDAKSLLSSGLKLFAAKDYLGALSVFQTAYARFPSGKILLNIGTTLVKLERKAEAANAYQGYLDSADADPAKTPEVTKVLAGLDVEVARIELTVAPADAEVSVGTGDWVAATTLTRTRVTPGSITVRARKTGFKPAEDSATVAAGGKHAFSLTLDAEIVPTAGGTRAEPSAGTGLRARTVEPAPPQSRFGMLAIAHVDPKNKGGAALLGIAFDVASRIQLQAAALLGPSSGAYAGASLAILPGRIRPLLVAGVPIFVANGARVAIRGAAGIEISFSRHLAVVAELGVEHVFNPEASVKPTLFIPAVGVIGRL